MTTRHESSSWRYPPNELLLDELRDDWLLDELETLCELVDAELLELADEDDELLLVDSLLELRLDTELLWLLLDDSLSGLCELLLRLDLLELLSDVTDTDEADELDDEAELDCELLEAEMSLDEDDELLLLTLLTLLDDDELSLRLNELDDSLVVESVDSVLPDEDERLLLSVDAVLMLVRDVQLALRLNELDELEELTLLNVEQAEELCDELDALDEDELVEPLLLERVDFELPESVCVCVDDDEDIVFVLVLLLLVERLLNVELDGLELDELFVRLLDELDTLDAELSDVLQDDDDCELLDAEDTLLLLWLELSSSALRTSIMPE